MKQIDEKYEVLRPLGQGGMGSVFEARHLGTGRRVAVKVILEEARFDPDVVRRFYREARAAGTIESEHITQVLDSGTDGATGNPYLVMELLSGEDLDALYRRNGPLREELALRIAAQALTGLARAHAVNVVHRDIKPANVFLAKRPDGEITVKLCDFGIAKMKADPLGSSQNVALTQTSALLGSPLYMSPEQAKGAKDVDARSDLWSLGVVLYQLLAGITPHAHADTLGLLLLAICSEAPPPIQSKAPWVSKEAAAVIERALTIDLPARFQSADEMFDAVRALLPGGVRVHADMLTPLTDEERAFVATRAPVAPVAASATLAGPAGAPAGAPASTPALTPEQSGSGAVSATSGAYSRSGRQPAQKPRRVPIALVGAAIATVGVVATLALRSTDAPRAPPRPPEPLASAPPSASAPASAASIVRADKTVRVSVPSGATVAIDGRPASVEDGGVALQGALGSAHEVRVTVLDRTTSAQVVIADTGAVPPEIRAPEAARPRPTAAGSPPVTTRPPTPSPPPPPPPPPPPSPKPAPSGSSPLSREFN